MTRTPQIRHVGRSPGVIQAKEITEGTSSHRVVKQDPGSDRTMRLARATRRTYRNALRKLA